MRTARILTATGATLLILNTPVVAYGLVVENNLLATVGLVVAVAAVACLSVSTRILIRLKETS